MKLLKSIVLNGVTGLLISVAALAEKPNVILIMTDDQGYGDLACHGNPYLKTPELDKMHAESIRFTNFHVSPFCTPTRASLMTGKHAAKTGAYRTTGGLSILFRENKTIANLFQDNGYATGMFGKWHLGDHAPQRPQDFGFEDVVWHRAGGIGQATDYPGNDYFDDTYERVVPGDRKGKLEKFSGYCTDVFFQESLRFVKENKDKPFFLYLPLNAPHGPYHVDEKWAAPYKDNKDIVNANFYGMIANIDWNFGKFRAELEKLDIADNTILIFMTDNGTSGGGKFNQQQDSLPLKGYNAGMRGKKSSLYDGGHRVPFFLHWANGGLTGGKDIDTLAAHYDVLPTLAELCGITLPEEYELDGISLNPLIKGETEGWQRDHLVLHHHGGKMFTSPITEQYADVAVMTQKWRLVNSWRVSQKHKFTLYDIQEDPSQEKDVSAQFPEVVARLKEYHQPYWDEVSPIILNRYARIDLGNPDHNPTELCSQDWVMEKGYPPYSISRVKKLPKVIAPWKVHVKEAGRYRITLRQLPKATNKTVVGVKAKIEIAGITEEVTIPKDSKGVDFTVNLPEGDTDLITYIYNTKGEAGGAYFTEVELLD
ncbi:arylsulfatase [Rubritalea spongiae]|uniref:Arylsulfatase n=2 Tax=Bacteria TaxID=2 RepID=A0ABW5DZE4_9BACT